MAEYPTTRLDRAIDAAIKADSKRPRPPFTPCRVNGCGLAAGHVERAGTDHKTWRDG